MCTLDAERLMLSPAEIRAVLGESSSNVVHSSALARATIDLQIVPVLVACGLV